MMLQRWQSSALGLLPFLHHAAAFIPAQPINDTSSFDQSEDLITIAFNAGVYSAPLSRQLTAWAFDDFGNYTNTSDIVSWTKYSKGVLVHFDEASRNQPPSAVPWIAMINCDTNGTDFSNEDDIFTITRDQGAQAALLYSLSSQGCLMNSDYLNNFEKVLDVYATTSISASRLIDSQFNNYGVSRDAYDFNSQRLNDSAPSIQVLLNSNALYVTGNVPINATDSSGAVAISTFTIDSGDSSADGSAATSAIDSQPTLAPSSVSPTAPTSAGFKKRQATRTYSSVAASATVNYLAAVMASRNNTVGIAATAATPSPTPTGGGGGGPNTGLAMIILYAITGVVTFLFLIVILSGAVRAMRHPERYGPRPGTAGGGHGHGQRQQSRAHGLTRAILDTFPVVKFGGRTASDRADDEAEARRGEDVEAGNKSVELAEVESRRSAVAADAAAAAAVGEGEVQRRRSASTMADNASFVSAAEAPAAVEGAEEAAPLPLTINPADVDDSMTCPICVCEFEEGEDVRILPCDGRHRFHRDCIDPWLLEVSSLCPLCRLDLSGATAAAARERDRPEAEEDEEHSEAQVISNLRAMLHGRRASVSSPGSQPSPAPGAARNRFFRYVATRRRQQHPSQSSAL